MAQVLVRDLEEELVDRLKERARNHGRSLQGEVKAILEGATKYSMDEALAVAKSWQKRLEGRTTGDSAELIREDRDR